MRSLPAVSERYETVGGAMYAVRTLLRMGYNTVAVERGPSYYVVTAHA